VPKLTKLYHIILHNARSIFLFLPLLFISFSIHAQSNTDNEIRTVVIDAGHGGKDPGTMGTKRYAKYEKHIALAVSLKLGSYITNSFPDIDVVYTRKDDIFLELNERTELANNANADLFISIHCDGFTNSRASGASVFVMGMSKLKANLDVAMRENSAIYMEDNYQEKYDGFDPKSPESYIVFSLMQNTYLDQSLQLAENVEHEFSSRANRKSRGVKQAPFYVISRTNMPSILVECGFLTNPKEEDFLQSDIGQDYIASAIFRAFRSYKESLEAVDDLLEKEMSSEKEKLSTKEVVIQNLEDRLSFKVQIGTYLKSMKNESVFVSVDAEERLVNGVFKYYVGDNAIKKDADKIRKNMLGLGFQGAFIVAFYKDERISMKEALDLQKIIRNND